MKWLRLMFVVIATLCTVSLVEQIVTAAPTYTITQKWQRCYPGNWCETGWYASPAVADLEKDGIPEVLWGGYSLMAVTGTNGSLKWNTSQTGRLWPGIVVADLDRNGSLEVVTGNGGGYIDVYNANGSAVSGWHLRPTGTSNELRSLAVANVDTNSDLEIAVCSTRSDNQWFIYEHTAALRTGWPQMTDGDTTGYAAGCFNENVGLADIDNDGRGELIGPNDTHYATAFNDDGSPVRANSIYGQVGGQNKPWARVGLHVDHAVDLRGYANCGTEHRPNMANSAPTIADVNGDGTLEIIIVGNVYNCAGSYTDLYEMPFIFKADRTRWKDAVNDWTVIPVPDGAAAPLSEDYNVIENSVPNPVVADLDGDGRQEILYPSYDGRVHAYWLDKTEHGSWPFEVDQHAAEGFYRFASEPVVVDLTDDGKAEVIFASWTQNGSNAPGKLYIVSWDGNLIQSLDLPKDAGDDRGGSLAAPTVANIDTDRDLEIVVGTINKGLVAYDIANTARARILWGTGRGNYQRTGQAPYPYYINGSLDKSAKIVSTAHPSPGQALTYTLLLTNPGPLLSAVRMTDTLPGNAHLVNGSVNASSGMWGLNSNVLTWTGAVSSGLKVTVTYVMTTSVSITPLTLILNTAFIDDGMGNILPRTSVAIIDGYVTYLPLVRK